MAQHWVLRLARNLAVAWACLAVVACPPCRLVALLQPTRGARMALVGVPMRHRGMTWHCGMMRRLVETKRWGMTCHWELMWCLGIKSEEGSSREGTMGPGRSSAGGSKT